MNFIVAIFATLAAGATVLGLLLFLSPQLLTPTKAGSGSFIAEIWLKWPVCRGSTLYRQRFRYHWMAHCFAKVYAVALDCFLPTHYRCSDCSGRSYMEKYDYGIIFGVRKATACEHAEFRPIWSPVLPGHTGFAGEHASAHPWLKLTQEAMATTHFNGCRL